MLGIETMIDAAGLVTWKLSSVVAPSPSSRVCPAETFWLIATQPWLLLVLGVRTMPALPAATRLPPEMVTEVASRAPLSLQVGPAITTSPPVIVMVPLESKPSQRSPAQVSAGDDNLRSVAGLPARPAAGRRRGHRRPHRWRWLSSPTWR